jgi:hypothetical protein
MGKQNKSLKAWVAFVKSVQKKYKLSYKDAIHKAKELKDKGADWMKKGLKSMKGGENDEMYDGEGDDNDDEMYGGEGDEMNDEEMPPTEPAMEGGRRRRRTRRRRGSRRSRGRGRTFKRTMSRRKAASRKASRSMGLVMGVA